MAWLETHHCGWTFQAITYTNCHQMTMRKGVRRVELLCCTVHADHVPRRASNLKSAVQRVYAIATLLNPGFKCYDFIDDFDFIPAHDDKAWATRELRTEWKLQLCRDRNRMAMAMTRVDQSQIN